VSALLGRLGGFLLVVALYGVALWLALAYWALRDARARSASPPFHYFAVGINLALPLLGLLIYILVRPGTTLADERAMAMEAEALTQTAEMEEDARPCPACGREIELDFVLCPYCHTRFAKRCPSCKKSVRLGWTLCPYCASTLELGTVTRAASQG